MPKHQINKVKSVDPDKLAKATLLDEILSKNVLPKSATNTIAP